MGIDIRGAIEQCTEPSVELYYVVIRGRIYVPHSGMPFFRTKAGAYASVMHFGGWQRVMKKLAFFHFAFLYPEKLEMDKIHIKPEFWWEYSEFEKAALKKNFQDQVEIKTVKVSGE